MEKTESDDAFKPRRLSDVIEQILPLIPDDRATFKAELRMVKVAAYGVSPKVEGPLWHRTMALLHQWMGNIEDLREDWKRDVAISFMMPDYLLEYLKKKWGVLSDETR